MAKCQAVADRNNTREKATVASRTVTNASYRRKRRNALNFGGERRCVAVVATRRWQAGADSHVTPRLQWEARCGER